MTYETIDGASHKACPRCGRFHPVKYVLCGNCIQKTKMHQRITESLRKSAARRSKRGGATTTMMILTGRRDADGNPIGKQTPRIITVR